MTLKEAYEYGQEQLRKVQIEDADIDAWYLLEYVTGINRAMYFIDMNHAIGEEAEAKYRECITIRS